MVRPAGVLALTFDRVDEILDRARSSEGMLQPVFAVDGVPISAPEPLGAEVARSLEFIDDPLNSSGGDSYCSRNVGLPGVAIPIDCDQDVRMIGQQAPRWLRAV